MMLAMFPRVPYSLPMAKNISEVDRAERRRIGATIRTVRQMRGFKPDEFASEIGVSRPYLANIEAGRKPVTEVLLARMSDALMVEQIALIREGYFVEVAA